MPTQLGEEHEGNFTIMNDSAIRIMKIGGNASGENIHHMQHQKVASAT